MVAGTGEAAMARAMRVLRRMWPNPIVSWEYNAIRHGRPRGLASYSLRLPLVRDSSMEEAARLKIPGARVSEFALG
jgi:hypothetical protein